jgi:glycosyltransferase involved in cell wall biosynthesis
MTKVSAVIPTYNRLSDLRRAVDSVRAQTHKDMEIIVVDDASTQEGYLGLDLGVDVKVIRLPENTKKKLGFPCAGYTRTTGMKAASGEYIAVLDDDDIWLPSKIEKQLSIMSSTGCEMSATEAYIGGGPYVPGYRYPLYNGKYWFNLIKKIYEPHKGFLDPAGQLPAIFTRKLIYLNNCCVCSSVILSSEIYRRINYMPIKTPPVDYSCWLEALKHTDCAYIADPHVFYNSGSHARLWDK